MGAVNSCQFIISMIGSDPLDGFWMDVDSLRSDQLTYMPRWWTQPDARRQSVSAETLCGYISTIWWVLLSKGPCDTVSDYNHGTGGPCLNGAVSPGLLSSTAAPPAEL